MKNFVQDGTVLEYANVGSVAINSGDVVLIGSIVGVAVVDIPATTGKESVQVVGVFNLPAAAGAWSQGDALYWDATPGVFTKTTTGNVLAGYAFADKASSDVLGNVKINAAN